MRVTAVDGRILGASYQGASCTLITCSIPALSPHRMSAQAGTPAATSQSPAASPADAPPQDALSQNASQVDRVILEYLRTRGHTTAERALLESLDGSSPDSTSKEPDNISAEDLIKKLAVYVQKPSRPGENVLKDSSSVLTGLSAMGNPSNIHSLIASIGAVGAEEVLSLDPTDKQEGFRELESWVDGSLDMYRVCGIRTAYWNCILISIEQPEFRPILFPIFCHFYLDLIQHGFKEAGMSASDCLVVQLR